MYKDPLDRLLGDDVTELLTSAADQNYAAFLVTECVVELSRRLKISPFAVLRVANGAIRKRLSDGHLNDHPWVKEVKREN